MLENVQIFWEGIWLEATVAIIIFLAFLLIRSIFTRYIFKLLLKLSKKTAVVLDDNILLSFERPLKAFFIFLGLYLALTVLPLTPAQDAFIARIFRSSLIILITWGLYNLTGVYSSLFVKIGKRMNLEIDSVLLPFLSTLTHFIIIALALSVLVGEWGYDISGIIAGLGLGGLAVALAAQDALSNIFGGMVILLDKPFSIGDWIYTPSVEGTVEDISFRSTRIRTFAQSLVTVPNSKLANEAITNWSRMGKRRVTFNLGVTYS
ncbi:MAG: mechanosensitive ion channel, partial [Firmicutes bacterium]|nr:mechanosensitive ion channel [Bacillota bacterium]